MLPAARSLNRRRILALSLLFHLPFLLFRVHRPAYDTYVHIFLADHYRESWWNLWEPRWYLGFSAAAYPPLAHQLIALLSQPASAVVAFFAPAPEPYPGAFRWLGEEIGFTAVLLSVLCLFSVAVRAFARVFTGPRAADIAALLAIFLPSLNLAAWAFGQLPTLAATTALLFALARGSEFLRTGRPLTLAQAVALAGVVGALHHGVFLFAPIAGLAVAWAALRRRAPLASLKVGSWKWRLVATFAPRLLLWLSLSALAAALVLWPFLAWSRGQSLQTPIDHASRHNFLVDAVARNVFFWPMYGPLLLVMLITPWLGARWPRLWPLVSAGWLSGVLGLGGTTPLPAWLFGPGWEWLTYDRFAFWASAMLLPLAGAGGLWLMRRWRVWGRRLSLIFLAGLIACAALSGWLVVITRAQPDPIEVRPFVVLLNQPEQRPYRYLTLGFGDQFPKLSALTSNGSPDGNYHTARQLPELRASGLGALDTAVWNPRGVAALLPFLARPERYGLRWVFANHHHYVPALVAAGWRFRWFEGDVTVWDKPGVPPLPVAEPAGMRGSPAAHWWGAAPLAALGIALGLWALERRPWRISRAQLIRGLAAVRGAGWCAAVVLLSLWWHHHFRSGAARYVYFTYQSVLLFASDAALALTLSLWAVERWLRRDRLRFGPRPLALSGLALVGACALSAPGAQDWALALAFSAHLLLLAGAYVCLVNDTPDPAFVGRVSGAVLLVLSGLALWQAIRQETWAMNLPWPGALTAATPRASVAVNADGARWLRAYATLPHPNILGGVVLVYLGGVIERYLRAGRWWWLGAAALGGLTLALTFSRAAWLGAVVMELALLVWVRAPHSAGMRRLTAAAVIVILIGVLPLLPFFLARTTSGGAGIAVEQNSINDRARLIRAGLDLIRSHPWLGVGAGNFVLALSPESYPGMPLEPVHNVILLTAAETGLPGALALAALMAAIALRLWRRRRSAGLAETVWASALIGVLVTALLDHFWWSLPPARTLLVILLALWAGSGPGDALTAAARPDAPSSTYGGFLTH